MRGHRVGVEQDGNILPGSELRLGVPNRSSLLHIGAVAQCVAGGLIARVEYHPAKLHYRFGGIDIILTSAQNLVALLAQGRLDTIFTGDDYVREAFDGDVRRTPFPFLRSRMALIRPSTDVGNLIESVYTRYPKTARNFLNKWGVEYGEVVPVGGGTEAFCFINDRSSVFDVVSTGTTVVENGLAIVRKTPPHTCSWFSLGRLPDPIMEVTRDQRLLKELRGLYQDLLSHRDIFPYNTVTHTVNRWAANQDLNQSSEHLRRVGLFAGAFSRVHEAHVANVDDVLRLGLVSRVIVLPASDHYPKPGLMPSSERLPLLEEAFGGRDDVVISMVDIQKDHWPTPLESAAEIEKDHLKGGERLVWIMGGDRLHWIAEHSNLQEIVDRYPLVVSSRPPYTPEMLLDHPVVLSVRNAITFYQDSVGPISSTEIRQRRASYGAT